MTSSRFALLSCAALAAAVTTTPHNAIAAGPKACPQTNAPVCAVAPSGENQTYSNSCFAKQANARILAPGRCPGPICTFIYEPVCARDPKTNQPRTYPNLCAAENLHATLIQKGACK